MEIECTHARGSIAGRRVVVHAYIISFFRSFQLDLMHLTSEICRTGMTETRAS
jgi:hypothetical protein